MVTGNVSFFIESPKDGKSGSPKDKILRYPVTLGTFDGIYLGIDIEVGTNAFSVSFPIKSNIV